MLLYNILYYNMVFSVCYIIYTILYYIMLYYTELYGSVLKPRCPETQCRPHLEHRLVPYVWNRGCSIHTERGPSGRQASKRLASKRRASRRLASTRPSSGKPTSRRLASRRLATGSVSRMFAKEACFQDAHIIYIYIYILFIGRITLPEAAACSIPVPYLFHTCSIPRRLRRSP